MYFIHLKGRGGVSCNVSTSESVVHTKMRVSPFEGEICFL